jgi:hypothetical protein
MYIGNSNVIEIQGLKAEADGSYVNNANCGVTITDLSHVPLSGGNWPTWPQSMSYVPNSNGFYQLFLKDDWPLDASQSYLALVEADAGQKRVGYWEFKFKPQIRKAAG